MKWDKLVGCKFHITDHEALETIKMSNCDGKSRCLIHWDKYLSWFKYKIMHVPGEMNKVACYYENDWYNEIHNSHHYVSADIQLYSNHEDLTDLHLQEISNPSAQTLTRRLCDWNKLIKDWIAETEWMADIIEPTSSQNTLVHEVGEDITIVEALQNGPHLHEIIFGDRSFVEAIKVSWTFPFPTISFLQHLSFVLTTLLYCPILAPGTHPSAYSMHLFPVLPTSADAHPHAYPFCSIKAVHLMCRSRNIVASSQSLTPLSSGSSYNLCTALYAYPLLPQLTQLSDPLSHWPLLIRPPLLLSSPLSHFSFPICSHSLMICTTTICSPHLLLVS